MASVPVAQTNTLQDILQLALMLKQASGLSDSADAASNIAKQYNTNYMQRYNTTESAADSYLKMIQALQPLVSEGMAEGDLVGRTNQIFSAIAPTVDRANAISASQGFAKSLRNGMADSTQAADNANNLTRNFGDVYQKLMETSRQRAFDELKQKLAGNTQALQAATQGFVYNNPINAAKDMATQAATRSTNAQTAYGNKIADTFSSNIAKYATDAAGAAFKSAGGFSGLLSALNGGIGKIASGSTSTPNLGIGELDESIYGVKNAGGYDGYRPTIPEADYMPSPETGSSSGYSPSMYTPTYDPAPEPSFDMSDFWSSNADFYI